VGHEIGLVSPKRRLDMPALYPHGKWALPKDVDERVRRPLALSAGARMDIGWSRI